MNVSNIYKFSIGDTTFKITVDNTFSVSTRPSDTIKDLHYHAEYELFILDGGKLFIYSNNGEPSVYSDCIVTIPPFFPHFSIRAEGISYRFLFSFSQKQNKGRTPKTFQFYKRLFNFHSAPYVKNDIIKFCEIITNIRANKQYDLFADQKIIYLLQLILYNLIPNTGKPSNSTITNESYLMIIEDIIFNRYKENITLKQLAETLHLSPKQTSRILMNNYHKSFSELLTEKRLHVATQLLRETNIKISRIVEKLNFNSESYFFRLFKKYYKQSPSEYRKNNKMFS